MQITLTVPEPIATRLEEQASQLNVSMGDLMLKICADRLAAVPNNKEGERPEQNGKPSLDAALDELVMRIRATPPNPASIIPASLSFDEVERLWRANAAQGSDISPAEWDRLWAEFEQEQKQLDWADDRAEGR